MPSNEYMFYFKGERWFHTLGGKEFKIAKAVYSSFVDTSLDLMDPSWDIEYIDGNPDNCAATNLRRKADACK